MKTVLAWIKAFALAIGGPGLFIIAFLDSSFLSFPQVNDLLVISMVVQHPVRMVYYAAMATLGSVAGCLAIYDVAPQRRRRAGPPPIQGPAPRARTPARRTLRRPGAAGRRRSCRRRRRSRSSCSSPVSRACAVGPFAAAIAVGRGVRYFGIGLLAVWYGQRAIDFLEENGRIGRARDRRRLIVVLGAAYLLWNRFRRRARRFDAGSRRRYHALTADATMSPDLSVVIPIRNEAPNLPELYREFTETLTAWGRPYEIILIDDGSTDDSFAILAELQAMDPRVRVIRFRRNFGQTAAFAAGFDHARGALIVTADGDLQNDPRDIPRMVDMIERGRTTSSAAGARIGRTRSCHAPPAVDARQPPDLVGDRRPAARLRLLAEGVPRRGRQAAEAVRRDAPVPAGDRQRAGRHDSRGRRQPPRATARHVEVRHLANDPRHPRPADGEVPPELLDAAAADLRPDRRRHGLLGGARRVGLAGVPAAVRLSVDRQPAAAAVRHPADLHRRAAGDARAARRAAGAHVSRVAGQADLRDPRDSREPAHPIPSASF